MLRVVVAMPDSLKTGHYEGLLGKFDGNQLNDLTSHGGGPAVVQANKDATTDDIYNWANACEWLWLWLCVCSLRMSDVELLAMMGPSSPGQGHLSL